MTRGNKKETVNANAHVQLRIPTYDFRVHTVQCMHTNAHEARRVGIDGPVNIRAVR